MNTSEIRGWVMPSKNIIDVEKSQTREQFLAEFLAMAIKFKAEQGGAISVRAACFLGGYDYKDTIRQFRALGPDNILAMEHKRVFGHKPMKAHTKNRFSLERQTAPTVKKPSTTGERIDAVVAIISGLTDQDQNIIVNTARMIAPSGEKK